MSTARLASRAVIAVSGPDWRSFMQGQVTQDVETMADGEARFAGLLAPQGRLLFDLFIIAHGDAALIDVAADKRDALIARLNIYKLRAKVEFAADDRPVLARWSEDGGQGWTADPRLPALGFRGYGVEAATNADEAAYDAHRLSLGVPGPADWDGDKTYPIEANFDLLAGIDFKKGCFVGQETTSRMKRRGPVKNRMLPITFDGTPPAFGAEVLVGDLRAGEVLSGIEGRAMAVLRLDRIVGADLTVDGRPVRTDPPSWFPVAEQTAND